MKKPIKLIDNHLEFNMQALDYLIENQNDFLVVGVLGNQGVGKSTLLNLVAHSNMNNLVSRIINKVDDSTVSKDTISLKTDISSDSKSSSDVYSECSDIISCSSDKASVHSLNHNVDLLTNKTGELTLNEKPGLQTESGNCIKFEVETEEQIKFGVHCTNGVDMYITSNRVILLDSQPLLSVSILDKSTLSSETKSMTHEVAVEMESLYLATFILASCHIVLVVQDWFIDSNILRFLNTADMLRPQPNQPNNPQHTAPEENLLDQFGAQILLVHNKAQLSDFSGDAIKHYSKMYDMIFNTSSKLKIRTGLGSIYDKKVEEYKSKKTSIDKKQDVNLFMLPEVTLNYVDDHGFKGHDSLEALVKRLRQNILGASRGQIAPSVTSEKHWGHNAHKTWETIKKSGLFLEYCRMLH
uniref:Protein SMG9 n=1 Tax=Xenopsylla cheopis TaxID=163159 RepID=A0A6M2DP61_XENCH